MTVVTPLLSSEVKAGQAVHAWLRKLRAAYVPGVSTPLSARIAEKVMDRLTALGHEAQEHPTEDTDVLLTTAVFGAPLQWRTAPFFQARRQYRLRRSPTVFTVIHVRPAEWAALLAHFEAALARNPPDLADFAFPGLAPTAHRTLIEQGRRGGPILAAERLMQAQALCLRLIVAVGEDEPLYAHHFDLVGSYARTEGDADAFYDDIVRRMATAVSAEEVGKHVIVEPPIARETWQRLTTPAAMHRASLELGRRGFFTEMVRIPELVQVPALGDAIATQYSEGCFATWEPDLNALVTTTTGSARPVDKGNITDNDLAVVVGLQPGGLGPIVRQVEGLRNDPPSSEGLEMYDMDEVLPAMWLNGRTEASARVPVARSKLHGHRGIAAYDPRHVEYIPMAQAFFAYPVTCGTYAQARGLKAAFSRSAALQNPADPRQVVFTILPTHGIFVVEKWAAGKAPFQVIWEFMDAGYLQVDRIVPQGPEVFEPAVVMGEDAGM